MDSLRPMLWLAFAFVLFLMWQAWEQDHAPAPMTDPAGAPTTLAPRASAPGRDARTLMRRQVPSRFGFVEV